VGFSQPWSTTGSYRGTLAEVLCKASPETYSISAKEYVQPSTGYVRRSVNIELPSENASVVFTLQLGFFLQFHREAITANQPLNHNHKHQAFHTATFALATLQTMSDVELGSLTS